MQKYRIYELAKIYNKGNDEIIAVLNKNNIEVKNKGFYKEVYIGFLNSYKLSNKYILLVFTVEGKMKHCIFCYNKCEKI